MRIIPITEQHSEIYNDLVESLNEAIEHAQGKRKLRTNIIYTNKPKETVSDDNAVLSHLQSCLNTILANGEIPGLL